jgi:hypothetical protein
MNGRLWSAHSPAKRGGNRPHVVVREVVNGPMYILSTGCQWRAVAKDCALDALRLFRAVGPAKACEAAIQGPQ